jgi:hypothetical protein
MRPHQIHSPVYSNTPEVLGDAILPSNGNDLVGGSFSDMSFPLFNFEDWQQLDILGDPQASTRSQVSGNHKEHSCPRESYEIFRDLICPTPYLHAPESNDLTVSARLDEVLHFNKIAVGRLARILECPCARSGHRAMVHASIISRILIWYQQAAGWNGQKSRSSPSSVSTSSSHSTEPPQAETGTKSPENVGNSTPSPTLPEATGFTVEQIPLAMGTFNIDDKDLQAELQRRLVLNEVKKVQGLIEKFTSQTTDDKSANDMAALCEHVGAWLHRDYCRTVDILDSRTAEG